MKLRLTQKGISVAGFKLTADDIEQQVTADLLRYNKVYFEHYSRSPKPPLDVDNFIKELWGIDVVYEKLDQSGDEEVLGSFNPGAQCIVIDAHACDNPKRISFTVGHEAGHLSLHSFLFDFQNGQISGWKNGQPRINKNLERQADLYSASLLAPKQDIYNFLVEKGLSADNTLVAPIDLSIHADSFQEQFGLSRQALEIRLCRLNLPVINKKYPD